MLNRSKRVWAWALALSLWAHPFGLALNSYANIPADDYRCQDANCHVSASRTVSLVFFGIVWALLFGGIYNAFQAKQDGISTTTKDGDDGISTNDGDGSITTFGGSGMGLTGGGENLTGGTTTTTEPGGVNITTEEPGGCVPAETALYSVTQACTWTKVPRDDVPDFTELVRQHKEQADAELYQGEDLTEPGDCPE